MVNTFNADEMAIITSALLVATRAHIRKVQLYTASPDVSEVTRQDFYNKRRHYKQVAKKTALLYRKIANCANEPAMMHGYMDDLLKKFEDVSL